MRKRYNRLIYKNEFDKIDKPLLYVTIILIIVGFLTLISASYPKGLSAHSGNGFFYATKQLVFLILGIISMITIIYIPKNLIKKYALPFFIVTFITVLLLWSPLGNSIFGQRRWLKIPFISVRFQPSDFYKISLVLFFSKYFADNKKTLKTQKTFLKILTLIVVLIGPIIFVDFSTGMVMVVSIIAILFVAGMQTYQFVEMSFIGLVGLIGMIILFPYRIKRLIGFVNPNDVGSKAAINHLKQSLYAIAMGGITGSGAFHSKQKYLNLPMAHNDFIFAILSEEMGLIGAIFVICLFVILIYRGYKIAFYEKDSFYKYVAVGITTYIGIQTIFNLGVSCGFFPVTGITLPFFSYGGTALISSCVSIGLLLRISKGEK